MGNVATLIQIKNSTNIMILGVSGPAASLAVTLGRAWQG